MGEPRGSLKRVITLKLTNEQYEQLREYAYDEHDRGISEVIREIVFEKLAESKQLV